MSSDEEAPGYRADVHTALLEPIRLFYAPFQPAILNFMATLIVAVGFQLWIFLLVGSLVHVLMAVLTYRDIHLLEILWAELRYAAIYLMG